MRWQISQPNVGNEALVTVVVQHGLFRFVADGSVIPLNTIVVKVAL